MVIAAMNARQRMEPASDFFGGQTRGPARSERNMQIVLHSNTNFHFKGAFPLLRIAQACLTS